MLRREKVVAKGDSSLFPLRVKRLAVMAAGLALTAAGLPVRAAEDLDLLEQKAFQAAVQHVAPSVVRIEPIGGMERVDRVLFGTGPTTGLVIGSEGYLVASAFSFLHGPASILAQWPDGTRKPARLVATDRNRMIALLKVEPDQPLPVPPIAPQREIRVGQWAIAVGRAFEPDRPNLSVGIISALNRIWGKAIQTDARVSPNHYGGPLVDIQGRVLGVLVPLSPQETREVAGVEWYDSGIGFAVPAEAIQEVLPRLKQGKDLLPGVIGIHFASANLYTGEPVIRASRANSPARRAGLKAGDRIVEIEGRPITLAAQIKEELSRRYAGDTIRLVVMRDGKRSEHRVEMVAKLDPYEHPFLGVLPMRAAAADDGKRPAPGVPIRYVYPDSPAARAGLKPGDVLAALDGKAVAGAAPLRARLADFAPGEEVELSVRRAKETRKLKVPLGRLPEALPPATLPPAWAALRPSQGERPQTGKVALKVPEAAGEAWAYVPDQYDPATPHGLVVWLHAPGAYEQQALIERWKPLAARDRLILLVPKAADPARWETREAGLVVRLMREVGSSYKIDPARVVVVGREGGGTLAYLVAFGSRGTVAAVAAIDGPLSDQAPDNEPNRRLAFYLAMSSKSRFAAQVQRTVATLRQMKYPVTEKPLGDQPRDLNADELAELVRWIDTLDRI